MLGTARSTATKVALDFAEIVVIFSRHYEFTLPNRQWGCNVTLYEEAEPEATGAAAEAVAPQSKKVELALRGQWDALDTVPLSLLYCSIPRRHLSFFWRPQALSRQRQSRAASDMFFLNATLATNAQRTAATAASATRALQTSNCAHCAAHNPCNQVN